MKSHPSSRFLDLPLVSWFTTRGRDNWGWSSLWMERGTFWQIAKPPKRDRCPRRIWFTVRLRSDIKFQRRSLNRSSSWKKKKEEARIRVTLFNNWNWIGAKHNCTSQKEKKKKEKESRTVRLCLTTAQSRWFSLFRSFNLSGNRVAERDARKQGHGALNRRSIVTRAKTGKNWLAPPRVPTLIDIRRTDGWRVRSGRPRMHDSRPFHCAFTLRAGVRVQGSDGRTALKIETDWPIGREKKRRGWKVGRSVRKRQW